LPQPPDPRPRRGYSAAHHPCRARRCTTSVDSRRRICRSAQSSLSRSKARAEQAPSIHNGHVFSSLRCLRLVRRGGR
jgi:hypothetical protein